MEFMKVDGPGSARKVGPAKKAAKTAGAKGAGFSDALRGTDGGEGGVEGGGEDGVEQDGPVAGGDGLGSVDALLALQGADAANESDPEARRDRAAVQRGSDLLDRLDRIRLGLLSGALSVPQFEQLRRALTAREEVAADPVLRALVQDIELRVEVEIAKYSSRR